MSKLESILHRVVLPLTIGAGVGYLAQKAGVDDIGFVEGMKQTALALLPVYAAFYSIENHDDLDEAVKELKKDLDNHAALFPIITGVASGLFLLAGSYVSEKITVYPINNTIMGLVGSVAGLTNGVLDVYELKKKSKVLQ